MYRVFKYLSLDSENFKSNFLGDKKFLDQMAQLAYCLECINLGNYIFQILQNPEQLRENGIIIDIAKLMYNVTSDKIMLAGDYFFSLAAVKSNDIGCFEVVNHFSRWNESIAESLLGRGAMIDLVAAIGTDASGLPLPKNLDLRMDTLLDNVLESEGAFPIRITIESILA